MEVKLAAAAAAVDVRHYLTTEREIDIRCIR
jgi:hypothetical protein